MSFARATRLLARVSCLVCLSGTWHCADPDRTTFLQEGPQALVVTTDFQTGSLATISLADHQTVPNIALIHPDAICRYDPITTTPFVVNRLGADSIVVLTPRAGYGIAREYSVGAGSNAQDIAVVAPDRAYVSRLGSAELLVLHPITGASIAQVDLSPWSDADGVPEASWMEVFEGKLYLALQRLEGFRPGPGSLLLVLDAMTGQVLSEKPLAASNPFGRMRIHEISRQLLIPEAGVFGDLDGGIELFDLDTLVSPGLRVDEAEFAGDVLDAVLLDENKGYAVIGVAQPDGSSITRVVSFDPVAGSVTGILEQAQGFDHALLALSPDRSQLWIPRRGRDSLGVVIYDTGTDQALPGPPLDTGLPPYDICFVDP